MNRRMTYAERVQRHERAREREAHIEGLRYVYEYGQWRGLIFGFAYGAIIGIVLTVLLCGVAGC